MGRLAPDGLVRSLDGGATWELILESVLDTPFATPVRTGLQAVAISPADPQVVYAIMGKPFRAFRSTDGGSSWQPPWAVDPANPCTWTVDVFQAHPTDPQRLFEAAGCTAGRSRGMGIRQSRDQGASRTSFFRQPDWYAQPPVGGEGPLPGRFYVTAGYYLSPGQAAVFRTDDDGANWQQVALFDRTSRITAAAYDPAAPDQLYISLNVEQPLLPKAPPPAMGLKVTHDGGFTWEDVDAPFAGVVADLALSRDGHHLYAATPEGVWRLSLPPSVSSDG